MLSLTLRRAASGALLVHTGLCRELFSEIVPMGWRNLIESTMQEGRINMASIPVTVQQLLL